MSTQTQPTEATTAAESNKKPAFNLNASIQRVRTKWNAATRQRREQAAIAMQKKLASILMGAETGSLTAD